MLKSILLAIALFSTPAFADLKDLVYDSLRSCEDQAIQEIKELTDKGITLDAREQFRIYGACVVDQIPDEQYCHKDDDRCYP